MLPTQATLIDEKGRLWDAASPQLRKSLYLDGVQGDVSGALINNLGFVGVSARSGRVIIRFNPKAVSKAAVGALYYWLSSHISTRICLTFAFSGQDQRYEIFASARAALLRMEALLDCEHRLNWTPLFSARVRCALIVCRTASFGLCAIARIHISTALALKPWRS
jgi:hypothetical protein